MKDLPPKIKTRNALFYNELFVGAGEVGHYDKNTYTYTFKAINFIGNACKYEYYVHQSWVNEDDFEYMWPPKRVRWIIETTGDEPRILNEGEFGVAPLELDKASPRHIYKGTTTCNYFPVTITREEIEDE